MRLLVREWGDGGDTLLNSDDDPQSRGGVAPARVSGGAPPAAPGGHASMIPFAPRQANNDPICASRTRHGAERSGVAISAPAPLVGAGPGWGVARTDEFIECPARLSPSTARPPSLVLPRHRAFGKTPVSRRAIGEETRRTIPAETQKQNTSSRKDLSFTCAPHSRCASNTMNCSGVAPVAPNSCLSVSATTPASFSGSWPRDWIWSTSGLPRTIPAAKASKSAIAP